MSEVRYLLDTNVLSEPLRPRPNANVIQRLTERSEELATAAVVYHEICYGCQRLPDSRKRRAIEAYLQDEVKAKLVILPYDLEAAEWYAIERARLVRQGRTPPYLDGQIAARCFADTARVAAVNDLILVTNNTADYADFQNLQLENWFES